MSFYMARRSAGHLAPASKEKITADLISAGETGGTALLLGALVGYNAGKGVVVGKRMPALAGIPADLLIGAAGHIANFAGLVPEEHQHHVSAIANGGLASFAAYLGNGLGLKAARGTDSTGTDNTATVDDMSKSGTGQIRGRSYDPAFDSIKEQNPHFTNEQIYAMLGR